MSSTGACSVRIAPEFVPGLLRGMTFANVRLMAHGGEWEFVVSRGVTDEMVERFARAMWDAREATDPSGERTGVTEDDQTRAPVFWDQAERENLWPSSREDQRREARLVLELAFSTEESDG